MTGICNDSSKESVDCEEVKKGVLLKNVYEMKGHNICISFEYKNVITKHISHIWD